MKFRFHTVFIAFCAAVFCLLPGQSRAQNIIGPQTAVINPGEYDRVLYVSKNTGSDVSGDGSSGNPWETISHGNVPVYNIEVDGCHNFFVSDEKVLVHNKPMPNIPSNHVGSLKFVSDAWLKGKGFDHHVLKEGLPKRDIYKDAAGNLWFMVKKGSQEFVTFIDNINW